MNFPSLRPHLLLLANVAAFSLAGCDTLRPIDSKPPLAKMGLSQPFTTTWKNPMVPLMKYSVILPAGEYRPAFEDDKFYYYLAPSRVVYKDLNSSLLEGASTSPVCTCTARAQSSTSVATLPPLLLLALFAAA